MQSKYLYQDSRYTATTFLVRGTGQGSSGAWVAAEGEVQSDKEVTHTVSTSYEGPNENYKLILQWHFYHDETTTCYAFWCREDEVVAPDMWSTGNFNQAASEKHDDAESPSGNDCTVRSEYEYTTSTHAGERIAFSIGAGIPNLAARTKFTKSTTTKSQQSWRKTSSASSILYHHRFVDEGIDSRACPCTHPTITWTDTDAYDKTNPPAGSIGGSIVDKIP